MAKSKQKLVQHPGFFQKKGKRSLFPLLCWVPLVNNKLMYGYVSLVWTWQTISESFRPVQHSKVEFIEQHKAWQTHGESGIDIYR